MEILKAKIDWMEQFANEPGLYLLLKNRPSLGDFRYEERNGCYFAENQGLVDFFHYKQPGDGYAGRSFHLTMKDGSEKVLKGPWSSRASVMNREGFVHCIEATITEDLEVWERGHTFYSSAVTIEIAKKALKLIPGVELKMEADIQWRGEINYRIREIGKTLEESKGERRNQSE